MEMIRARISEEYYSIKKEINDWDFKKLTGVGKKSTNDKYAILEVNIY